ncbi:hypothetical protein HZS93_00383 [Xanthomonas citri]|nr:hypothetical protein HZS93_00383 [Xanthomonas citri]CCF70542.1 putative uncharacterized domain protein [Xanthomonas citri pv. punicae str. LMG 859]
MDVAPPGHVCQRPRTYCIRVFVASAHCRCRSGNRSAGIIRSVSAVGGTLT